MEIEERFAEIFARLDKIEKDIQWIRESDAVKNHIETMARLERAHRDE